MGRDTSVSVAIETKIWAAKPAAVNVVMHTDGKENSGHKEGRPGKPA
tara:strand:- start:72551 stop:72691 length:141 start_codon:yes stop_codon:yes gene_type:complete